MKVQSYFNTWYRNDEFDFVGMGKFLRLVELLFCVMILIKNTPDFVKFDSTYISCIDRIADVILRVSPRLDNFQMHAPIPGRLFQAYQIIRLRFLTFMNDENQCVYLTSGDRVSRVFPVSFPLRHGHAPNQNLATHPRKVLHHNGPVNSPAQDSLLYVRENP